MTDFKDFLDQLKIRLTNPLIFSFLFSWTIINWRVIIGAFYLDKVSLSELGHNNFLDFVSANVNWHNGICYPLISAILYTFISPILRLAIQWFNTGINKIGNNQIRKVAKDGFIQYDLYDQLLEEVQTQRQRNGDQVNENIQLTHRYNEQQIELQKTIQLSESLSREKRELSDKFNNVFNNSVLDGIWHLNVTHNNVITRNEEIVIKHSRIEVKQRNSGYYLKSYVRSFVNDQNQGISFVEELTKQEKFNYISNLQKFGDHEYRGEFNRSMKITLERIPD